MKTITHNELLAEQMTQPSFARAYEDLRPEFEIVEQIIALRIQRGLTQSALAAKVGTPQSSIARLESRQSTRNLDFVRRVAEALDARVEVRLVPKETNAAQARGASRKRKVRV